MNQKQKSNPFTLALVLSLVTLLTACGHNSTTKSSAAEKTKKTKGGAKGNSSSDDSTASDGDGTSTEEGSGKRHKKPTDGNSQNPSSADSNSPKCANTFPLDDYPSDWIPVDAQDLITQKEGTFELIRVQFNGSIEGKGKESKSAFSSVTTSTVISHRNGSSDLVAHTVNCKDIADKGHISFNVMPPDNFSSVDGSFYQQRAIRFYMKSNTDENSAEMATTKEALTFGADDATKAMFKSPGFTYDSRFYKISEKEFEARYQGTGSGAAAGQIVNYTFRYRLKKVAGEANGAEPKEDASDASEKAENNTQKGTEKHTGKHPGGHKSDSGDN